MKHTGNQAGPSSAKPETQQGLKETQQSGEDIVKGSKNDDQLSELRQKSDGPEDKVSDGSANENGFLKYKP
jgi:hypothetical protein